jgi:hypothetical protein
MDDAEIQLDPVVIRVCSYDKKCRR